MELNRNNTNGKSTMKVSEQQKETKPKNSKLAAVYKKRLEVYERSNTWQTFAKAVKSHYPECVVCNEQTIDIHHLNYDNLTTEVVYRDVIPVCRSCHLKIHDRHWSFEIIRPSELKVKIMEYQKKHPSCIGEMKPHITIGPKRDYKPKLGG